MSWDQPCSLAADLVPMTADQSSVSVRTMWLKPSVCACRCDLQHHESALNSNVNYWSHVPYTQESFFWHSGSIYCSTMSDLALRSSIRIIPSSCRVALINPSVSHQALKHTVFSNIRDDRRAWDVQRCLNSWTFLQMCVKLHDDDPLSPKPAIKDKHLFHYCVSAVLVAVQWVLYNALLFSHWWLSMATATLTLWGFYQIVLTLPELSSAFIDRVGTKLAASEHTALHDWSQLMGCWVYWSVYLFAR